MKPLDNEIEKVRLQTYIAHCGVCSRRAAMELIKSGEVKVNGKVVLEPSTPIVAGDDSVKVRNKMIAQKEFQYILLNKPKGYVTTRSDRNAALTVYNLIPQKYGHLSPVGRLDKDTEGLLLLTNDGDLTFKLTHPRFGLEKVYAVRMTGELVHKEKMRLEKGMYIDGHKTAPTKVKNIRSKRAFTDFYITLHEGRNRQIRRMVQKIGQKVLFLQRVSQGPIRLQGVEKGRWRFLTKAEKEALMASGKR